MRKLALCAVVLALAAPVVAQAESANDATTSVKASAANLDLNRMQDAKIMLDRLNTAALEACGASETSFSEYQAAIQRSACYQEGLSQAVVQLNAPQVSKLFERRTSTTVSSE